MTSGQWLPQQASFEVVRRGYAQDQVNEYIERAEYDLRIVTADRDSANHRLGELTGQMSAARAEAEGLRAQLDRTALEPTSMVGLSDRMQRMIRLAEEEAAEIRSRAEHDTSDLRRQLEDQLEQLALDRADFEERRDTTLLALTNQAREDAASAATTAERVRTDAEQEAAALLGSARDEADALTERTTAEMDELVRSTIDEMDALVRTTTEEMDTLVGAATAERLRLDAESQALRQETEQQAAETLNLARSEAAEIVALAQAEATTLDIESEAIRTAVEEDFDIAISARRTEATQIIADREASSQQEAADHLADARAHAQFLVQQATERAEAMVAHATNEAYRRVEDADQAVVRLSALRLSIGEQLAALIPQVDSIRSLAGTGLASLAGLAAEPGRPTAVDFDPDDAAPFAADDAPGETDAEWPGSESTAGTAEADGSTEVATIPSPPVSDPVDTDAEATYLEESVAGEIEAEEARRVDGEVSPAAGR